MLEDTRSETVIKHHKQSFAQHGIPVSLLTDNGPQYTSRKFQEFSDKLGFCHKTSSPHYPRSNSLAEITVQTVKNLLKKAKEAVQDPYLALLTYRDTPRSNDFESPAQLLLGRRLRSQIPVVADELKPNHPNSNLVHEKLLGRKAVAKSMHNKHSRRTPYQPLLPRDNVRIHNGKVWEPAEVVDRTDQPRSYNVKTTNGNVLRRNRSHLKKIPDNSVRTADEQFSIPIEESGHDQTDNQNIHIPPVVHVETRRPVVTSSGRVVKPNSRYKDYVK
ncbi:uncharacterized protein K02A2.6-like [Lineus longissimus]|uniref:uncharacterized protein K02A2.6-like n=1 Tax=Lineus longissimus TaxID=88925 RepID=UPI00315DB91B